MIARRQAIRRAYEGLFARVDGVSIFGGDFSEDNCWLTAITVRKDLSWTTGDLSEFLAQREIESRNLWKPMHLQPLYKDCEAFLDGTAEDLFATGLALPSGSNISKDQWDLVESAVQDFLALQR
jgi:dTDP-4-amino-4,6-dideoxygalactose transaminase